MANHRSESLKQRAHGNWKRMEGASGEGTLNEKLRRPKFTRCAELRKCSKS